MTLCFSVCSGTSLTETVLALGVASVGLTTIVGLLPVGLQTEYHAIQEPRAAEILEIVAEDLRTTEATALPGQARVSRQFGIEIPLAPLENITTVTSFFTQEGKLSSSQNTNSQYRLTVRFLPNAGLRNVLPIHLILTWPANAAPEGSTTGAAVFLSLDQN